MTPQIQGSIRPLKYPLKYNADIISETPDEHVNFIDLSDWGTTDPDERQNIVLQLSLNEYVAIGNTIDVGRDIAYGDNSIEIWFTWVRSVISLNICQSIIDCINDPDSGVSEAISSLVTTQTEENSIEVAQSFNQASLGIGANPTCNNDILYGQCLQLVEYLDEENRQLLQVIEVGTNILELTAQLIGNLRNAKSATVTAVLTFITFVQNSIADNYEAQITTEYLEKRACDLFCFAQANDCQIITENLFTIWQQRLNATVTIDSLFNETIDFLVSGIWTGTEIADFMFFAQLGFRSQIGQYLGEIAYADIDLRLRVYSNDPNPDWLTLCTDCPQPWEYNSDFDVTANDWIPYITNGKNASVYAGVGQGFISRDFNRATGQYWRSCAIQIDFEDLVYVQRIEMTYNLTKGSFSSDLFALFIQAFVGGTTQPPFEDVLISASNANDGTNLVLTLVVDDTLDAIACGVRSSLQTTANYSGSCKLVSVSIFGDGTEPPELLTP